MPDSVAFPLILGNFFVGAFFAYWVAGIAHEKALQIVTGVGNGARVPADYRDIMLWVIYVPYALGSFGAFAFVIATSLLIAPNVTGEDARFAAYLVAFMHSLGIIAWLTMGPLQVIRFRSVLRQAEAD
jgi:hypothetical protein